MKHVSNYFQKYQLFEKDYNEKKIAIAMDMFRMEYPDYDIIDQWGMFKTFMRENNDLISKKVCNL